MADTAGSLCPEPKSLAATHSKCTPDAYAVTSTSTSPLDKNSCNCRASVGAFEGGVALLRTPAAGKAPEVPPFDAELHASAQESVVVIKLQRESSVHTAAEIFSGVTYAAALNVFIFASLLTLLSHVVFTRGWFANYYNQRGSKFCAFKHDLSEFTIKIVSCAFGLACLGVYAWTFIPVETLSAVPCEQLAIFWRGGYLTPCSYFIAAFVVTWRFLSYCYSWGCERGAYVPPPADDPYLIFLYIYTFLLLTQFSLLLADSASALCAASDLAALHAIATNSSPELLTAPGTDTPEVFSDVLPEAGVPDPASAPKTVTSSGTDWNWYGRIGLVVLAFVAVGAIYLYNPEAGNFSSSPQWTQARTDYRQNPTAGNWTLLADALRSSPSALNIIIVNSSLYQLIFSNSGVVVALVDAAAAASSHAHWCSTNAARAVSSINFLPNEHFNLAEAKQALATSIHLHAEAVRAYEAARTAAELAAKAYTETTLRTGSFSETVLPYLNNFAVGLAKKSVVTIKVALSVNVADLARIGVQLIRVGEAIERGQRLIDYREQFYD